MRINQLINVFPIEAIGFSLAPDWFERLSPKLIGPSYMLMVILLIISVGIMVLKRFEDSDLEKKLWNIPVIITAVAFWPVLVIGLKTLIDAFNTFLIHDVFQIPWRGFGFTEIESFRLPGIFNWTGDALARLLPNIAYWVVYAFYLLFFFFYAILGPFVIAKGILFDEIESFLELLKEITLLFLWQVTLIVMIAFILPEIVSGKQLPEAADNLVLRSLILGITIFFIPSITNKFGRNMGTSFLPGYLKYTGIIAGFTAIGHGLGKGAAAIGLKGSGLHMSHGLKHIEILRQKHAKESYDKELKQENLHLKHFLEQGQSKDEVKANLQSAHYDSNLVAERKIKDQSSIVGLSKQAKKEMEEGRKS